MAAANEPVLDFGDLKIYSSQFEIGKEIVKKFDSRIASDSHPTNYINVIIVGPAFIDLRDQTREDIEAWKMKTDWHRFLTVKVVNSSSLKKEKEEFLECFEQKPGEDEKLHIVIHDEAHWGVRKESKINKFLTQLSRLQCKLKRKLLVLCVSATIYVLKDITLFQNEPEYLVDWTELRRPSSPFFEPRFEAPTYLAWEGNRIEVDEKLKNVDTAKEASVCIVKEYKEAMDHPLNNDSISMRVIKGLLEDDEPCMVVIRLDSINDASRLQELFINYLKNLTLKKKIYVIQYYGKGKNLTVKEQLNTQGYMVLPTVTGEGNIEKKDWSLKDLTQISCVVIVVDKLKMGARIPNTTKFYDLRSCYPDKQIGSKASWVQDVGRCAGHNKLKSNVFVGIDPKNEDNFKKNDQNLQDKITPEKPVAKPVPEFSVEVYEALKPYTLLLNAEPQIGKTGAIIAMLHILTERLREHASISLPHSNGDHNQLDAVTEEIKNLHIEENESSSAVDSNCELQVTSANHESNLKEMTKRWARMANEHFVLFQATFQDEEFDRYHDKLKDERDGWPDKKELDSLIISTLSHIIHSLSDEEPLKIADCGCGLYGLFSLLLDSYNKCDWDKRTIIDGFDIGMRIVNLQKNHDLITFNPHPGDMASYSNGNDYRLIMYGHSFFEENITRHINWAYNNLQNCTLSYLIIWDVIDRFPVDFVERMKSFGFKKKMSRRLTWFTFYTFYKEESLRCCSDSTLILFPY